MLVLTVAGFFAFVSGRQSGRAMAMLYVVEGRTGIHLGNILGFAVSYFITNFGGQAVTDFSYCEAASSTYWEDYYLPYTVKNHPFQNSHLRSI